MLLALFFLAFYKRKTFLIVFICSEQKFDTVTYNISDKLYRSLKTAATILSSWYETGSKHVTSAKVSNTKSSWKPITAGGSMRSVLGLVLFSIFIKDPKGGAANPQHFGRWQNWKEWLTASGVFLPSKRDLDRLDKWADRNLTMSRYLQKVFKVLRNSLSGLCQCCFTIMKNIFPDAQR